MHRHKLPWIVLPISALVSLASVTASANADAARTIATRGNPASMIVWADAEPIAVQPDGTVLAARAHAGKGRFATLGHGGFLTDNREDTQQFIDNIVTWLAEPGGQRVFGLSDNIRNRLSELGLELTPVIANERNLDFNEADIIVGSLQAFARAGRLHELDAWLNAGGALLAVETAWGQIQLKHAANVDDLAVNRLFTMHGVMYTDRALSGQDGGVFTLETSNTALANASNALRILAGETIGDEPNSATGDTTRAARIAREALAIVPIDSELITFADNLAAEHRETLNSAYLNMQSQPLRLRDQPLACALLDLDARRAQLGDTRAHPSASAFPGPVPDDAPRITQRIEFNDAIPGWRSTGLYAPPGEPITVRIIEGDPNALVVQIGAWLDPQRFDDRVRMPVAVFRTPLHTDTPTATTTAASPIGGPIYIDITSNANNTRRVIQITGAVEMPRYRLNHTDLDDWRSRIRHLPIPWAELESDDLVFTIPSDAIRDLEDPDVVMQHWSRIHDIMQGMEPRSPRHWPDRQYRYVADRRLSWGYMYCPADAPIVIPMTAAKDMVNTENYNNIAPNKLWGHYHEMGHAHQNPMWTFAGTGEVTVNIFTVLALNEINGYPLDHEATRTQPAHALATMVRHIERGAPFDRWKADPFLALQTYALLWHNFGWDAFRATFRDYDNIPQADRPRNDDDKRDEFVIRFSTTVGKNLTPYFQAWGIPLTERPARVLSTLPTWMPEGFDEAIAEREAAQR